MGLSVQWCLVGHSLGLTIPMSRKRASEFAALSSHAFLLAALYVPSTRSCRRDHGKYRGAGLALRRSSSCWGLRCSIPFPTSQLPGQDQDPFLCDVTTMILALALHSLHCDTHGRVRCRPAAGHVGALRDGGRPSTSVVLEDRTIPRSGQDFNDATAEGSVRWKDHPALVHSLHPSYSHAHAFVDLLEGHCQRKCPLIGAKRDMADDGFCDPTGTPRSILGRYARRR